MKAIGEKVEVAQLCPTLRNTMDYTVHGILQARILEWVAFPFSNPGIKPRSPALQVDSLPAEPSGKPNWRETVKSFILKFLLLINNLSRLRSFKKGRSFILFLRDCPII